jgi:hypothetical protein
VDEIASAFVGSCPSREALCAFEEVLAASKKLFDISGAEDFARHLPALQGALYLLFNEVYWSSP